MDLSTFNKFIQIAAAAHNMAKYAIAQIKAIWPILKNSSNLSEGVQYKLELQLQTAIESTTGNDMDLCKNCYSLFDFIFQKAIQSPLFSKLNSVRIITNGYGHSLIANIDIPESSIVALYPTCAIGQMSQVANPRTGLRDISISLVPMDGLDIETLTNFLQNRNKMEYAASTSNPDENPITETYLFGAPMEVFPLRCGSLRGDLINDPLHPVLFKLYHALKQVDNRVIVFTWLLYQLYANTKSNCIFLRSDSSIAIQAIVDISSGCELFVSYGFAYIASSFCPIDKIPILLRSLQQFLGNESYMQFTYMTYYAMVYDPYRTQASNFTVSLLEYLSKDNISFIRSKIICPALSQMNSEDKAIFIRFCEKIHYGITKNLDGPISVRKPIKIKDLNLSAAPSPQLVSTEESKIIAELVASLPPLPPLVLTKERRIITDLLADLLADLVASLPPLPPLVLKTE